MSIVTLMPSLQRRIGSHCTHPGEATVREAAFQCVVGAPPGSWTQHERRPPHDDGYLTTQMQCITVERDNATRETFQL